MSAIVHVHRAAAVQRPFWLRGTWPPLGVTLALIAGALPLLTWLNLGFRDANAAVTDMPKVAFAMATCGALAFMLARGFTLEGLRVPADPWLGAFVVLVAVNALRTHRPGAFELAALTALAALWLSFARTVPAVWQPRVFGAFLAVGLIEVGYALLQYGELDPLWPNKYPGIVHGTLGNPNWAGAFLALLVPLAPLALVPALLLGLLLTKSSLGMLAAVVGLAVAHARRVAWWKLALAAGALLALSYAFRTHRHLLPWLSRWDVWALALRDMAAASWTVPLVGWGPGGWYERIPALQLTYPRPHFRGEVFGQAHNEYLQLFYEHGVLGLAIAGAWLWSHRAALLRCTALTGSLAALAVDSLGMFPLRVPHVAMLAVVLMGFALGEEPA